MKSPVLLCFHLQGDKANKIRLIAMRFAIRLQFVAPEDYAQPLSALCGLTDKIEASVTAEDFSDEMLVMAFFPSGLAQQFLLAMRKAKIPPVALKAVLTETNSEWNAVALHAELSRERDAFAQGKQPIHEAAPQGN